MKSRLNSIPPEQAAATRPTPEQHLASILLVSTEDRAGFERLYSGYEQALQPADPIEVSLLQDLVTIRWRLDCLSAVEAVLFERAFAGLDPRKAGAGAAEIGDAEDLLNSSSSTLVQVSRLVSRLQQQLGLVLRQLKSWRRGARALACSPELQPGSAPDPTGPGATSPSEPEEMESWPNGRTPPLVVKAASGRLIPPRRPAWRLSGSRSSRPGGPLYRSALGRFGRTAARRAA